MIPYGDHQQKLTLPDGLSVHRLEPRTPSPTGSSREMLAKALERPIGSPTLAELASGKQTAAILIPGKARKVGARDYVPALIDQLNRAGIADDNIEIFLADGTHVQHLESDVAELLGPQVVSRVRCLGHDCHDRDEIVELGTTSFGTTVSMNRRVVDSDVKVLTGRIVPHYFAGFSGGRKAVIPGVAGFETIVANHRLTLGPNRGIHPDVGLCSLDQNPIHLDMVEAARMANPNFCLNTLLDTDHRMLAALAGDFEAVHEEGCRIAEEIFCLTVEEPFDAVITSAGGLPYDCNFMQALKAAFNVADIIRSGGSVLWIAQCPQGIHEGFLEWADFDSCADLDRAVRADYALTGHNSIMLRQFAENAEVALLSDLPPDIVRKLRLHPVESMDEGIQWISRRISPGARVAVVPHANAMCAIMKTCSTNA
jgi:nickel-dependent lactate racemase